MSEEPKLDMPGFMQRLAAGATRKGRADVRADWRRVARDGDFPLTPKGHTALVEAFEHPDRVITTRALVVCVSWLLRPADVRPSGLFLYGAPGMGKSWAAAFLCVVRHVMREDDACAPPEWIQGAELATRFHVTRDVDVNARTAVIDDLGRERITDGTISALESFLDRRGKPGRVTIITSNGQVNEVQAAYRERAASRMRGLFAGGSVVCKGKDLR